MEPLAALGLASNIVQIVDFSGRIISRSKEIYRSADGKLAAHIALEQAAKSLRLLSHDLIEDIPLPDDLFSKGDTIKRREKSAAEVRLLNLSSQTKAITDKIIERIQRENVGNASNPWKSVDQAFRSIWNEKELQSLEAGLADIREEINTALLFSLRERLDNLPEKKYLSDLQKNVFDFIKESEFRHNDLLNAINRNTHTDHRTVNVLSEKIGAVAQADSDQRFFRTITARLRFSDMPERLENIPLAHQDTFSWIFKPADKHPDDHSWNSFTDWLRNSNGQNLYWITGKPGSGKSTLMKYLFQNQHTSNYLSDWTGTMPLISSGFFFWNSGTVMQMSRMGLLQALLYQSIIQIMSLIDQTGLGDGPQLWKWLFQERWEQYEAFGGGYEAFTWPELRRCFELLISDSSRNFFFVIDGLDEFDGNAHGLNELIITASKRVNVKICVSSRPWLIFEKDFEDRPSLLLERLTSKDILAYVKAKFAADKQYTRLAKRDPEGTRQLIVDTVSKACGVFLWVYLVVESLIQGITNADRMSDLQVRLASLPSDLEDLFEKLLGKLDPFYYRHACQLFRLLNDHTYPPVLCLAQASEEDATSALQAKIESMSRDQMISIVEDMERRLKSRCMGLLEIFEPITSNVEDDQGRALRLARTTEDTGQSIEAPNPQALKVRYLHRTTRDFLRSARIWESILDNTDRVGFDVNERWAYAFLWSLKILEPIPGLSRSPLAVRSLSTSFGKQISSMKLRMWDPLTWCMEYALRMQKRNGSVPHTVLDELGRAAIDDRPHIWATQQVTVPHALLAKPPGGFLDIAVLFGLDEYARARLGRSTRDEAKRALFFSKDHKDMFSNLMKDDWLRDRKMLGEAFGSTALHAELRSHNVLQFRRFFRSAGSD